MRTYLKVVNPIVALVILVLCVYASTMDDGNFRPANLIKGGLATYFFAKGLFCSSTLFVLGHLLLAATDKPREGKD